MTILTTLSGKMSVREKILVLFLALSLVSLGIMGFLAFFTIGDVGKFAAGSTDALGNHAVNDSSSELRQEATTNMIRIASDQAAISNVLFEDTEAEMNILADMAETMQGNPGIVPVTRTFTRNTPPPDAYAGVVVITAPGAKVETGSDEYRSLAGMNDPLRAVFNADGDLTGVYVASDSGVMRSYPWNGTTSPAYDPRDRSWFTEAKKSGGNVWSEPYTDAAGNGKIITCSRAIKTQYGTWVIGSDVTLKTLHDDILNITLAGDGYAVLLDNKGNIISRPDLPAGDSRWDQTLGVENVFSSGNPELVEIGRHMMAGETGIARVSFNGSDSFVAYAPVKSLNWSFAVSMPVSKIIAPAMITEGRISEATNATGAHIQTRTDTIRAIFTGLFILILLIVIILGFRLARIITRPVESLKQATVALGAGDLDYRITLRTGDEFEDLANSFNQMASDLKQNIEDLKKTTTEKERYTKELEIAREIQESFLPESTPAIPGFEVAATTIPAMEIGGDLYDFIPAGAGQWGFVMADVSGKGVSAALFMALSRTLIRASGEGEPDPGAVVRRANRLIYEDAKSSMFITTFYAVLDPRAMTFSYVNAGHNPALLIRGDPAAVLTFEGRGVALGVVPDVDLLSTVQNIEAGDLIVMYTDGITEAFNTSDDWFGEERLHEYLIRNRTLPPGEIILGLLREIKVFTGDAPQSDDMTIVVIRVT